MSPGRVVRIGDWFREWRLPLKRYLVRRGAGTAADIDDIAQEVFLRLLRYNRAEPAGTTFPPGYNYQGYGQVSQPQFWGIRENVRF
jgi:Sigma-70 region 2